MPPAVHIRACEAPGGSVQRCQRGSGVLIEHPTEHLSRCCKLHRGAPRGSPPLAAPSAPRKPPDVRRARHRCPARKYPRAPGGMLAISATDGDTDAIVSTTLTASTSFIPRPPNSSANGPPMIPASYRVRMLSSGYASGWFRSWLAMRGSKSSSTRPRGLDIALLRATGVPCQAPVG